MLRTVSGRLMNVVRGSVNVTGARVAAAVVPVRQSHGKVETAEEVDARFLRIFNTPDLDQWQTRKYMNEILCMDFVPEPKIIIAGLKLCRRLNDYALAIRWLEGVRFKCGNRLNEIYPWIVQEIRPTLEELGMETPDELGYDKPELALRKLEDD